MGANRFKNALQGGYHYKKAGVVLIAIIKEAGDKLKFGSQDLNRKRKVEPTYVIAAFTTRLGEIINAVANLYNSYLVM